MFKAFVKLFNKRSGQKTNSNTWCKAVYQSNKGNRVHSGKIEWNSFKKTEDCIFISKKMTNQDIKAENDITIRYKYIVNLIKWSCDSTNSKLLEENWKYGSSNVRRGTYEDPMPDCKTRTKSPITKRFKELLATSNHLFLNMNKSVLIRMQSQLIQNLIFYFIISYLIYLMWMW